MKPVKELTKRELQEFIEEWWGMKRPCEENHKRLIEVEEELERRNIEITTPQWVGGRVG